MSYLGEGKKVEEKFFSLFPDWEAASAEDDIKNHIDGYIKTSVDVKGMKKVLRSDDSPNQNIHWIELRNVHGDPGWLYGKAQMFAFETARYFVQVKQKDLAKFIKENLIKKVSPDPALYMLYQRKGRKDLLTLVDTLDLCYLADSIIEK